MPLGITLCIMGLIGNVISVIVWSKMIGKKLSSTSSTSMFLIALAIADSGLLVFFLLTVSVQSISPSLKHQYDFNTFYAYFGFPMFFFFIVSSIWLVVGVAINRVIVVYYPMKVKSICTSAKTGISILVICLFCFVINIPHFFNYHVVRVTTNNTAKYDLEKTEYAKRGSAQRYGKYLTGLPKKNNRKMFDNL